MLEQLINLFRRRPRLRAAANWPDPATPYVSFRVEGKIKGCTIIWVLDRRLCERSRYRVYWN